MMRKFKHRTLGWIAKPYKDNELYPDCYQIVKDPKEDTAMVSSQWWGVIEYFIVYKELIENSQDREEVIEKDWKQKIIDDTNKYWVLELRNIIEKHAPKQVKFTRDNIQKWYNNYPSMDGTKMVRDFLKDHNLLDEEPQWETCEHESDWWVYLTLRKEWEEVKPPKSKCKKCWVFYRN